MGYTSISARWILMFLNCVFVVNGAQNCSAVCKEGEYCSGSECLPCPPRTYQKDPFHYSSLCKPWTTKPPQSHYIIVKNGTSKSDVEWCCEDGYMERQYTVGGFECIPIQATTSPVSSTTQLPTSEPITISLQAKQHSGNNIDAIVGGVVGSVVAIIFIVVVILYWKQMLCFAKWRLPVANGNTAHTVVFTKRNEILDETEKKVMLGDTERKNMPDNSKVEDMTESMN